MSDHGIALPSTKLDIRANQRACCCCPARFVVTVDTDRKDADDLTDRAAWVIGWAEWQKEWYCPPCLALRPHVLAAVEQKQPHEHNTSKRERMRAVGSVGPASAQRPRWGK